MPEVEERVDHLERILGEFITSVGREFNKLYNSQMRTEAELREFKDEVKVFKDEMKGFKDEMLDFKNGVNTFKDEMLDFKDEMKAFKDEMLDFKDEMKAFKDEMLDFKDEMKAFKDEMLDFKDEMKAFKDEMLEFKNEMKAFKDEMAEFKNEMRDFKDEVTEYKDEAEKDRKTMNKQWSDLAKKMGTVVEDLVAPSIPRIAKEEMGLELEFFGTRIKKKLRDGRSKEYDVIATAGEYVLLNSTKSTFESNDVKDFFREIKEFRDFFPEYKEKKIIGIIASLYLDESIITYAEKSGLFALAVGEDLMEVKNSKGFKPKEW